MRKNLTRYRIIFTGFLACLICFLGFRIYSGQWLQTDLSALLPKEQNQTTAQRLADKHLETQLNNQFIALVGHNEPQKAFSTAQYISQQWKNSGLFKQIDSDVQPILSQLQEQIKQLSFATLPKSVRQQLLDEPQIYFQQYAQQLIDPFNQYNLLPLEQDWLGFGRFVLTQGQLFSQIQWDPHTGMVYINHNNMTWVLLRAEFFQNNLITPQQSLLALVEQNQQIVDQQQAQLLVASSALLAATAKQTAEKESVLMSILGISITLILLLTVFKTIRILWLFLPIIFGMLAGISAILLCFGQVHILTLVIGTSLIGVLIDLPLHWLSSSLFTKQWQGQKAMNQLQFTFMISLFITLLGYALLGFTALPILQQTALFSGIALITSVSCTMLYLPPLFIQYQSSNFSNWLKNISFSLNKKIAGIIYFILSIFIIFGLHNTKWQDDIQQWISISPKLINQLQQISQITGIDFGSQYFLITAENNQELLIKSGELSQKLEELQKQHKFDKFQSLNQWVMSEQEQIDFAKQLKQRISNKDFQILAEIGLPLEQISRSLENLPNQSISLEKALQTKIGQGWQSLYLGEIELQKVATLIKVSGIKDITAISALADQQNIFWQDKRTHLNYLFQQTRDQAAWLKLLSFILAGLFLWKLFGARNSIKILIVPLIAITIVIAIFGYLNLPIGLFTMFGLLLVSVISIDYTAYIHTAKESLINKRFAVLLAAITTMISFILLGFSNTPAIATFGLSVSLGIALSVIISFKVFR